MTLLEELIAYVQLLDLDVGPLYATKMPASPDRAVAVARYGGPESRLADNYDEPRVQFRTRGPSTDHRVAERDAELLYDALNGLQDVALPGGTRLSLMVGLQAGPVYIGQDQNGRAEFTVNFRCEISRTSTNREN
ncbi:minor capsid protein [Nonomuraea sp. NPDC049486]|uniref:minor capsid protein n=1 Tax=Nonomuraea sp. NPDC049486 TaxID=3155773 RepID=UPI0034219CD9